MKSSAWRRTIRVGAILGLVVSVMWLLVQPGFEPLAAVLVSVVTLITSFVGGSDSSKPSTDKLQLSTIRVSEDAPPAVQRAVEALDSHHAVERKAGVQSLEQMNHEAAVDALIGALKHPARDVRILSLEMIRPKSIRDERIVFGLAEILKDTDWSVRRSAAIMLGETQLATAAPILIQLLCDENEEVRIRAAVGLKQIGKIAVPSLMDRLQADVDNTLHAAIASVLGEIGDDTAIPVLIEALHNQDQGVRKDAALALGQIGNTSAVIDLLQALRDKDSSVRIAAAKSLGAIGDPTAMPGLIGVLADENSGVRSSAARSLGEIGNGNTAIIPHLINALGDVQGSVRSAAATALAQIGNATVAALVNVLGGDETVGRSEAAWAIGKIGDSTAVPALVEAMQCENYDIIYASAIALGQIADAASISALLNALGNNHVHIRDMVSSVLKHMGNLAVPSLIEMLRDQNPEIQQIVSKTLVYIASPEALAAVEQWRREQQGKDDA